MEKITYGRGLSNRVTVSVPAAPFALPGVDEAGNTIHWPMDFDLLSGGVLLLGDSGTGKSNVMGLLARQIRRGMGPDDIMIAFDIFGKLAEWSYRSDWVVERDGWNIPQETGGDERIARRLAEALTDGCLPSYSWICSQEFGGSDSALLMDAAMSDDMASAQLLARLLTECAGTPALCSAIERISEESGAAKKLSDLSAEVFAGHFSGPRPASVRSFFAEGGRAMFVQSGFADGRAEAACAIMSTAVQYAVQEKRRVFFLLDDFEYLSEMGSQTMNALRYAKNIVPIISTQILPGPNSILRSFGTKIVFRTSDRTDREAFADACAVDCGEIVDFERGCAAVRCAHFAPFRFMFKKNPGK